MEALQPTNLGSFATNLFSAQCNSAKGTNVTISPTSIYIVLSLTANGAKNETLKGMLKTLQGKNVSQLNKINGKVLDQLRGFTCLEIANSVMTKFNPLPDFVKSISVYESPVEKLVSVAQVNNWCKAKTKGKIPTIINELPPECQMILLNAVYFKDDWKKKFDARKTDKKPFFNLGTQEKKVDMMHIIEKFHYFEEDRIQAIILDYKNNGMNALVILPPEGTDINSFISTLSEEKITHFIKAMKLVKVNLSLPKFELNYFAMLNQILGSLGMEIAFQKEADFSLMKKENDIYITRFCIKLILKLMNLELRLLLLQLFLCLLKDAINLLLK